MQKTLIQQMEGMKQSAGGSQRIEVCIAVDAYNHAIDQCIKLLREWKPSEADVVRALDVIALKLGALHDAITGNDRGIDALTRIVDLQQACAQTRAAMFHPEE